MHAFSLLCSDTTKMRWPAKVLEYCTLFQASLRSPQHDCFYYALVHHAITNDSIMRIKPSENRPVPPPIILSDAHQIKPSQWDQAPVDLQQYASTEYPGSMEKKRPAKPRSVWRRTKVPDRFKCSVFRERLTRAVFPLRLLCRWGAEVLIYGVSQPTGRWIIRQKRNET